MMINSVRHYFTYLLLPLAFIIVRAENNSINRTPLVIMEYNTENLFDCQHDTLKEDYEFTPNGARQWTFPKYWRKLNDIARVIYHSGVKIDGIRHLPDLVAMIEVENDSVMHMLTRRTMLKAAGYRYFITSSKDGRGVDVALMYNPLTFLPLSHHSIRIRPPKHQRPTRDILYVKGITLAGDTLHIMTLHAPSRGGGQKATEHYRIAVANKICNTIDSIRIHTPQANIIIMGDFNDYSHNKSLIKLEQKELTNISSNAKGKYARGTYKYQGRWNSLDHIFISKQLAKRTTKCFIYDAPWMLKNDNNGYTPRRTFLGNFYQAGISDHLPLVVMIE